MTMKRRRWYQKRDFYISLWMIIIGITYNYLPANWIVRTWIAMAVAYLIEVGMSLSYMRGIGKRAIGLLLKDWQWHGYRFVDGFSTAVGTLVGFAFLDLIHALGWLK